MTTQDTISDSGEKSILDIFNLFPDDEQIQNVLVQAASAQTEEVDSYDMPEIEDRHHSGLCFCCSDSRETVQGDTGKVSFMRIPGGFLIEPDGELSDDAGFAIEKIVRSGKPTITVRQHSRCGAMGIIYAYHSRKDGEAYVKDHYGAAFADMAKERANLYNEVRKHVLKKDALGNDVFDFSHYVEKYGIPLSGDSFGDYDDAAKFQTCMAIQQGVWDRKAALDEIKTLEGTTEVLSVFNHVAQGGRKYIQMPGEDRYVELPVPTDADYETKLSAILDLFPFKAHERIRAESVSQEEWAEHNEEHILAKGKDMSAVQAPPEAVIRSTGKKSDEDYEFAKKAGQALFLRLPESFATHADGRIKASTAQFQELARAYGVPVIQLEQLCDSEGLRAIYQYNKDIDGEESVIAKRRPSLVRIAKRRASLYTAVKKRVDKYGFAYYERMGVPLGKTEEERFVACMAIHQALMNYNALCQRREKEPNLPATLLFFKTLDGSSFVFDEKKKFHRLPKLEHTGDVASRPGRHGPAPKGAAARP